MYKRDSRYITKQPYLYKTNKVGMVDKQFSEFGFMTFYYSRLNIH